MSKKFLGCTCGSHCFTGNQSCYVKYSEGEDSELVSLEASVHVEDDGRITLNEIIAPECCAIVGFNGSPYGTFQCENCGKEYDNFDKRIISTDLYLIKNINVEEILISNGVSPSIKNILMLINYLEQNIDISAQVTSLSNEWLKQFK